MTCLRTGSDNPFCFFCSSGSFLNRLDNRSRTWVLYLQSRTAQAEGHSNCLVMSSLRCVLGSDWQFLSDSWADQLSKLKQIKALGGGYKFGGYYHTCGLINFHVAAQGEVPVTLMEGWWFFWSVWKAEDVVLCLLGESYAKQLLPLSSSWSIQVGVWSPVLGRESWKGLVRLSKTLGTVLGGIPKLPEVRCREVFCSFASLIGKIPNVFRVWEQRKACPCAGVNVNFYQCENGYWSS